MPEVPRGEFIDEDEDLLRAIKEAPEGDLRAFEELMQRHQRRIMADCRLLTHGSEDAEDLAQEVFVKAYFGLSRFEGRSSFRHWLQRIKVNHCLNHLKQRGGELMGLDDTMADSHKQLHVAPEGLRSVESSDNRRIIAQILDTMPATLRIPLIMRDMDELSYEEIATALGLGLSAVKMRIKRARETFRRMYESEAVGVEGREAR